METKQQPENGRKVTIDQLFQKIGHQQVTLDTFERENAALIQQVQHLLKENDTLKKQVETQADIIKELKHSPEAEALAE